VVATIRALKMNSGAVVARDFTAGGAGATDLAAAVWAAAEAGAPEFRFLYPDDAPLRTKIETIATRIYGADGVDFQPAATKSLAQYEAMGFGQLPICMAKTQYSLSHDPKLLGRPTGFRLPIREVRLAAGAGFVTPIAGDMRTMPGLNSKPGGERIDIDADGNTVGLF
jgi:formate--tetrahydrofolate ligase